MAEPCAVCMELLRRVRLARRNRSEPIMIRTWCRVCGEPAHLELAPDYFRALAVLLNMDKLPMFHVGGNHKEDGGWGVNWRFDEVMSVAFPAQYSADRTAPFWQSPSWSKRLKTLFEDTKPVERVYSIPPVEVSLTEQAERRRILTAGICAQSKSRMELEQDYGEVWTRKELLDRFDIIGTVDPCLIVIRKDDQLHGTLFYQDEPNYYFGFSATRII